MLRSLPIMWLCLAIAPAAVAASATEGTESPAVTQPAPGAAGSPPTQPPPIQEKLTISGPQMLEQGREYRREIEAIRIYIQGQAEAAKNDKDVIRLTCLLDKQTQLGANAKLMDQTLQALQEVIMRRDESAQLHEYTRVTIIHQKAQVLRTEADACVGAETNYVGPTRVVVEAPAGLTEGVDQPAPVAPPFTIVDRPVPASRFQ